MFSINFFASGFLLIAAVATGKPFRTVLSTPCAQSSCYLTSMSLCSLLVHLHAHRLCSNSLYSLTVLTGHSVSVPSGLSVSAHTSGAGDIIQGPMFVLRHPQALIDLAIFGTTRQHRWHISSLHPHKSHNLIKLTNLTNLLEFWQMSCMTCSTPVC